MVRVTVVPGNKVSAAIAFRGVSAGNVQGRVSVSTGGENNGVIVFVQLSYAHVAANFHVTDQANVAALQNLV